MKTRFGVLGFGLAVVLAATASLLFSVATGASSDSQRMRWDIIQLSGTPPNLTVYPGGKASALADGSSAANPNKITVTGSGTFNLGNPSDVSGGGHWATSGQDVGTHDGTYTVTGLISFELAPGSTPPQFIDKVTGVNANFRGGLAFLRIAYSDGSKGVLAVSCHPPAGSPPPSIFEGITASKGFVNFWNRVAPSGAPPFSLGNNENRTQFHVLT